MNAATLIFHSPISLEANRKIKTVKYTSPVLVLDILYLKRNSATGSFGNNGNVLLSSHKAFLFTYIENLQWNIDFRAGFVLYLSWNKENGHNCTTFDTNAIFTCPLSFWTTRPFRPVISATFSGPPSSSIS